MVSVVEEFWNIFSVKFYSTITSASPASRIPSTRNPLFQIVFHLLFLYYHQASRVENDIINIHVTCIKSVAIRDETQFTIKESNCILSSLFYLFPPPPSCKSLPHFSSPPSPAPPSLFLHTSTHSLLYPFPCLYIPLSSVIISSLHSFPSLCFISSLSSIVSILSHFSMFLSAFQSQTTKFWPQIAIFL